VAVRLGVCTKHGPHVADIIDFFIGKQFAWEYRCRGNTTSAGTAGPARIWFTWPDLPASLRPESTSMPAPRARAASSSSTRVLPSPMPASKAMTPPLAGWLVAAFGSSFRRRAANISTALSKSSCMGTTTQLDTGV